MELPQKIENQDYAEISMTINKKRIITGENIKGEVNLTIKQAVDNCVLRISFIGKEYCEFKLNPAGPPEYDESLLFPQEDIVPINGISCTAGSTYKHPYKFVLPERVPASFEEDFGDSCGYIRYLIHATF